MHKLLKFLENSGLVNIMASPFLQPILSQIEGITVLKSVDTIFFNSKTAFLKKMVLEMNVCPLSANLNLNLLLRLYCVTDSPCYFDLYICSGLFSLPDVA